MLEWLEMVAVAIVLVQAFSVLVFILVFNMLEKKDEATRARLVEEELRGMLEGEE